MRHDEGVRLLRSGGRLHSCGWPGPVVMADGPGDALMGEPVCPSGDGSASDPDRFARIVERSEPGLRRFLGRLGLRGCDVDDVVQETYLRAWRGFGRFRGESRVSTWITRIAINLTHRGTAQRRRMVPLSEQAGAALASRPGLSETALVRAYEQALGGSLRNSARCS